MCCGHKPRLAKLLQIWKIGKRKVLISVEVVCAEDDTIKRLCDAITGILPNAARISITTNQQDKCHLAN